MAKTPDKLFHCRDCDAQTLKWAGQCETCGHWGTLEATSVAATHQERRTSSIPKASLVPFAESSTVASVAPIPTGLSVWDTLLSGGVVPGSVTLVGGEPGIGKSTLLAQLALCVAMKPGTRVCYVTGEESPSQVGGRLRRLSKDATIGTNLFALNQTDAPTIAATLIAERPNLTIIDSIQTLRMEGISGEPGNPTQVKASTAIITEAAKRAGIPVVFVGQVNKDGDLAGPRLVEHLVDTVLMMEGDRLQHFRWLNVLKHRYGATDLAAALHMTERGLEEIKDPSAMLLQDRPKGIPGSIVTCLANGHRPVLCEIQALVTPAGYATPSRRATGIDQNRLSMLLAVLARRAGIPFGDQDVFVNAVGGVDAKDPSADLAIALALVSAKNDVALPADVVAWGEVGLAGELRAVTSQDQRKKEAERLGFKTIITPGTGGKTIRDLVNELRLRT